MAEHLSSHIQYGTVRILVPGAAKEQAPGVWHAVPSVVWIQCGNMNLIVDPGGDTQVLQSSMLHAGLDRETVSHVFITHGHLDHYNLLHLFPQAVLLDGYTVSRGAESILCPEQEWLLQPDLSILVIKTPGHCEEHASLLVPTLDLNMVCIAGDLFWWTEDQPPASTELTKDELMTLPSDSGLFNTACATESRKKILRIADFIIPGHGPMIRVTKS